MLIWGTQLAGTVAIAIAIYVFFGGAGPLIGGADPEWMRFGLLGILAASAPALWYLRRYKATLDSDVAATRQRGGVPDPQRRLELLRQLSIGGALCEIPLALGVIYLLAGGQTRWFVTAVFVSVALRLSYRPFTGASR